MTARQPYRVFDVSVDRIEPLSESFVRVTFGGPELTHFECEGFDQRVKLLLPNASGGEPDLETGENWFATWRSLSDADRPPMRTYTVRRWREAAGSKLLEVDFVLHGDGGPASRWVRRAKVGDRLKLIGPDALSGGPWGGIAWNPPTGTERHLLAGDETAAPAIAAVLESLAPGTEARAFIEVPSEADVLQLDLPTGIEVTWLPRADARHGALLTAAVIAAIPAAIPAAMPAAMPTVVSRGETASADQSPEEMPWDVPGLDPVTGQTLPVAAIGELYAWLAGEASVITGLRRHLVRGAGIDRRAVAFMGYWREGRAES